MAVSLLPVLIIRRKSTILFQKYALIFHLLACLPLNRIKICIAKDLANEYAFVLPPFSEDGKIDNNVWKPVISESFE